MKWVVHSFELQAEADSSCYNQENESVSQTNTIGFKEMSSLSSLFWAISG